MSEIHSTDETSRITLLGRDDDERQSIETLLQKQDVEVVASFATVSELVASLEPQTEGVPLTQHLGGVVIAFESLQDKSSDPETPFHLHGVLQHHCYGIPQSTVLILNSFLNTGEDIDTSGFSEVIPPLPLNRTCQPTTNPQLVVESIIKTIGMTRI